MTVITTTLRALCAVLLACGLCVATVAPASAHDRLVKANPAAKSTLSEVPTQGVWTFSANILPTGSAVSIAGPDGELAVEDIAVDGKELSASLEKARVAGDYTVTWRVVSSDGHPISGSYVYTVAPAAISEASPTTQATETTATTPAAEPSTDAVTPSTSASSEVSAADTSSEGAGSMPVILGGVAVVVIGIAAWWFLARRRSS